MQYTEHCKADKAANGASRIYQLVTLLIDSPAADPITMAACLDAVSRDL